MVNKQGWHTHHKLTELGSISNGSVLVLNKLFIELWCACWPPPSNVCFNGDTLTFTNTHCLPTSRELAWGTSTWEDGTQRNANGGESVSTHNVSCFMKSPSVVFNAVTDLTFPTSVSPDGRWMVRGSPTAATMGLPALSIMIGPGPYIPAVADPKVTATRSAILLECV